jgi:hypothetical protein
MTYITSEMLHQLGIHKSEADEKALIEHFEQTLNERVGVTIVDLLDDTQVEQLMDLTDKGDQEATTAWLQKNVPEYDDLVKAEFDILMGELAEGADEL